MKKILLVVLAMFSISTQAQTNSSSTFVESPIELTIKEGKLSGTLCLPNEKKNLVVALLISGSGPTDRDGNNPMMKNNSLKFLAQELAKKGIASVRYDKRGIAASATVSTKEEDVRFEDFISDAQQWIELLKKDKRFNQVVVAGHSEGSLIGMNLSNIDKFVSLAGAGQSADLILKEQLSSQPQMVKDMCFPIIDKLKNGELVEDVNPVLNSVFRKSIQPYMISWFKHNPQEDIKKLNIPVLIVQGTTDIQVSVKDAELLSNASKNSKKVIIEGMNHIFKTVGSDQQENLATYNNPDLPISGELVNVVTDFLLKKNK